jgi:hypothetical protein
MQAIKCHVKPRSVERSIDLDKEGIPQALYFPFPPTMEVEKLHGSKNLKGIPQAIFVQSPPPIKIKGFQIGVLLYRFLMVFKTF